MAPIFLHLLVLLSSTCMHPHLANSKPHNNITDLASLQAFRSQLSDPLGILSANWTTNTPFCSWIGITCGRRHNLRVAALNLSHIPLQGTISPYLGNLSFLSVLSLDNATLTGPIPNTLKRLPRLRELVLQRNYLSGPLPSNLFNTSSLVKIAFAGNNLSGPLPSNASISSAFPRFQVVSLSQNQFTGQVPSGTFARFLDLQKLSLSKNHLTGTIPAELGYLRQLTVLYLGANQLTGEIPSSLGNLTNLQQLEANQNKLTGRIPTTLGNLRNLQTLFLGVNGLTGSIPESLMNASNVRTLFLTSNKLVGPVPPALGESMQLLERVFLADNSLTGGLGFLTSLCHCENLQRLDVQTNELDGFLPDSVGNMSSILTHLYLAWNHIKGSIPAELGNLSSLLDLDLGGNELTGSIPPAIARLRSLQFMDLGYNRINGSIPPELGLMTRLNTLRLGPNRLSGAIPNSIVNLTELQSLLLGNNKLSSEIPRSIWTMKGLLTLNLTRNALVGSIPPAVSGLEVVNKLDLSGNQLSGNISNAIGKFEMLTELLLSNNYFSGQIPASFGGLLNIRRLDLSKNLLSGAIPNSLANLRHLDSLNLSFNMLEGQIPRAGVFSNASILSLEGNIALCGVPQLGFQLCAADNSKPRTKMLHLLMKCILPVVALSCFILIFALVYGRRKATALARKDSQLPGNTHRIVSYHELVRATGNFSEENLLGRGRFGSVFKGCLDDGLIVAVKVLNLDIEGASKSFDAECGALCNVRHRNLIKIVNVCCRLDFKALILQFMPNGSLEDWLYCENRWLNLQQRLNVMLDVALGLEYLHHNHPHVILHCDLKPGNVLLDEEMVGHVSDFGIAKILLDANKSTVSASTPGTLGYIAPEYAFRGELSKMADVYSFGILLLETFTGKRPTDVVFDGESNLRECVCNAFPDGLWDVVDYNLAKEYYVARQQLEQQTIMHQCLSSVIELGLLSSSHSPKERIPMVDIVPRLQKLKVALARIAVPSIVADSE